ncbi:MAG: ribonuclease R [Ignavibacteria bacterium]|nr:ribonuclease R [Ignavibacteria bacterium]
MNFDQLANKVLDFLAKYPNQSFKMKEISRRIGVRTDEAAQLFKEVLRTLEETRQIKRVKKGYFSHLDIPQHVQGVLELSKQGLGFVTIEGMEKDVFVAPRFLGTAVHGDTVEVALFAQGKKKKETGARREGEIVRVIKRGRASVVGTLERMRKVFFVIPDDRKFSSNVVIPKDQLHGASEGEKVVVEIESWGRSHPSPQGRVVEVLGTPGEVGTEMRAVIREFRLPDRFPDEVQSELHAIPLSLPEEEIRRRRDLRKTLCLTIDPEDAKDFDDAVSLERLPDGDYTLGVHIADVSYYVREGTALDKEALLRGTSVYLPNHVVPMLPETLSNVVCSLKPNEDRFAFSVLMTVTPRGVVKSYEIVETVIRSRRRLSYEQAEFILTSADNAPRTSEGEAIIHQTLHEMHHLSSVLTKKRMRQGSIDFETAEAKFRFDAEGRPVEVIKKVRLNSHRLVEEFMLLANQVVARHIGLDRKEDHAKPFLYRVHDAPDPDRIRELSLFVNQFGFKLDLSGGTSSKALQRLLTEVRGSEVENVINEVALRSMAKAIYSERNIGHYGLAFDYYSHFTSPIRRYPDLMIHRVLKEYQRGVSAERRRRLLERMPSIAQQSSVRERVALEAERAATKVMQAEFLKRHVGDEFAGVISGVAHYGIFIELTDSLAEGMIHVRDMEDDYYVYDEQKYALVGRHHGNRYRLGDIVKVRVLRVNPEEREIDLILA